MTKTLLMVALALMPRQQAQPQAGAQGAVVGAAGLRAEEQQAVREAIAKKDYRAAQAYLLDLLDKTNDAARRRTILMELGSVYFLDHDPTQAAVAWNKADALGKLPEKLRFSLAMAYVQMGHGDWAEAVLKGLRESDPANALYPFWLGRIAYDRQVYDAAIVHFREAIRLDAGMAKAHDNLGLSLYDVNDVDGAIAEFKRAIELDREQGAAAAWPQLNLGIAYDFRGQTAMAVEAFRQAVAQDAGFAEAHYRLGNALLKLDRLQEAVAEEQAAVKLDAAMAEPHIVLARLYRRMGREADSKMEEAAYQKLHQKKLSPAAAPEVR